VSAGRSNPGDVDRHVADRIGRQQCDGGGHHDATNTKAAAVSTGRLVLPDRRGALRLLQDPSRVDRIDPSALEILIAIAIILIAIALRLANRTSVLDSDNLIILPRFPFKTAAVPPPGTICKDDAALLIWLNSLQPVRPMAHRALPLRLAT
jgi:hypothetical protein